MIISRMATGCGVKGDPEEVLVHNFLIKELGRVVLCGVYDLADDAGWASVGTDHDTAAFAYVRVTHTRALRQWRSIRSAASGRNATAPGTHAARSRSGPKLSYGGRCRRLTAPDIECGIERSVAFMLDACKAEASS